LKYNFLIKKDLIVMVINKFNKYYRENISTLKRSEYFTMIINQFRKKKKRVEIFYYNFDTIPGEFGINQDVNIIKLIDPSLKFLIYIIGKYLIFFSF